MAPCGRDLAKEAMLITFVAFVLKAILVLGSIGSFGSFVFIAYDKLRQKKK